MQTFGNLLEDLHSSELEAVRELLGANFNDFKLLYEFHFQRIQKEIERLEAIDASQNSTRDSS